MENEEIILAIYYKEGNKKNGLKILINKLISYITEVNNHCKIHILHINCNIIVITCDDIDCVYSYFDIINKFIINTLHEKSSTVSFIGVKDEVLNYIKTNKENFNKKGQAFVIDGKLCSALNILY